MDRNTVVNFENDILEALKEKYYSKRYINKDGSTISRENIDLIIKETTAVRFDILKFYDAYVEHDQSHDQSKEKLDKLTKYLFDIKIQLFYLSECDQGLYNTLLFDKGFNPKKPKLIELITKLSLDQTIIFKSTTLWERIFNFVRFYITGKDDAEFKKNDSFFKKILNCIGLYKSDNQKDFFKLIKNTPWKFISDYKNTIKSYRKILRNPETHKNSPLREIFQEKSQRFSLSEINVLYNIAVNVFYPNMINIVKNIEPQTNVWVAGMKEKNTIT